MNLVFLGVEGTSKEEALDQGLVMVCESRMARCLMKAALEECRWGDSDWMDSFPRSVDPGLLSDLAGGRDSQQCLQGSALVSLPFNISIHKLAEDPEVVLIRYAADMVLSGTANATDDRLRIHHGDPPCEAGVMG